MNRYSVYMHISPNNKKYIGITLQEPKKRWLNGYGYKHNQYFTNAINKYGWDNFQHIIIAKGLTENEAKWLEIKLIKIHDTTNRDKGYNISLGGDIVSDETRNKLSESLKGEGNGMYGKHHTEEAKKKMSESRKGRHHSNKTKCKMSKSAKGRYSGKNNPNAKSVICLTTKKIFLTAKDGAEYYGTHNQTICACCKGKYKSSGIYNGQKLVWRYVVWKHNKTYRINLDK